MIKIPHIGLQTLERIRIQNTHSLKTIPSLLNFRDLQEAYLTVITADISCNSLTADFNLNYYFYSTPFIAALSNILLDTTQNITLRDCDRK